MGLDDPTIYLFSVTAYNSAGLESAPSNEVAYTTPSSPSETYSLTVNNGSGDGTYPVGQEVTVTADPPQLGEEFQIWEGDIVILDDFTSETTQAVILSKTSPLLPRIRRWAQALGCAESIKRSKWRSLSA
jgi:hypothetical protein